MVPWWLFFCVEKAEQLSALHSNGEEITSSFSDEECKLQFALLATQAEACTPNGEAIAFLLLMWQPQLFLINRLSRLSIKNMQMIQIQHQLQLFTDLDFTTAFAFCDQFDAPKVHMHVGFTA